MSDIINNNNSAVNVLLEVSFLDFAFSINSLSEFVDTSISFLESVDLNVFISVGVPAVSFVLSSGTVNPSVNLVNTSFSISGFVGFVVLSVGEPNSLGGNTFGRELGSWDCGNVVLADTGLSGKGGSGDGEREKSNGCCDGEEFHVFIISINRIETPHLK